MVHQSLRKTRLKAAAVASASAVCVLAGSTSAAAVAADPIGDGHHYRHHHAKHVVYVRDIHHGRFNRPVKIRVENKKAEKPSEVPEDEGKSKEARVYCDRGWVAVSGSYTTRGINEDNHAILTKFEPIVRGGENVGWKIALTRTKAAMSGDKDIKFTPDVECIKEKAFPVKKSYGE